MRQRYTWNKAEKLKSRKRIDQVFKQGKNFSVFPFKVFYLLAPAQPGSPGTPSPATPALPAVQSAPSPAPPASPLPVQASVSPVPPPVQAGFGAGSRHFKKAVDRNRIKRVCREAYRLQKQALLDHLGSRGLSMAVFFIYIGKDLPDYKTATGKMGVILQKLVKETA
jgi:ribonuclease P protein component